MRFIKNNLYYILFLAITLSCEKEKVETTADYGYFTSLVGPEGRILSFVENNSNIPENMFPVLEIEPNTFEDTSIIKMYYSQIASGNIPEELTSISENNILWQFECNSPNSKPIKLTIPFNEPDNYLKLGNYKYLFKLYNIVKGNDKKKLSNWSCIENYELDTSKNAFITEMDNFQYAYCVFFEEIKIEDLFILSVNGSINDIYRHVAKGAIKFKKDEAYLNSFINENGISYYSTTKKSKNIDFSIAFSFNGSSTGTYSGNETTVEYCYEKDSLSGIWINTFHNSKNITINIIEYGKMGEMVKGNIYGALYNMNNDSIEMHMDFEFRRVR